MLCKDKLIFIVYLGTKFKPIEWYNKMMLSLDRYLESKNDGSILFYIFPDELIEDIRVEVFNDAKAITKEKLEEINNSLKQVINKL